MQILWTNKPLHLQLKIVCYLYEEQTRLILYISGNFITQMS